MMVVVREQFAAGGAEGTDTWLSVGLVNDRKTLRQSELTLKCSVLVMLYVYVLR